MGIGSALLLALIGLCDAGVLFFLIRAAIVRRYVAAIEGAYATLAGCALGLVLSVIAAVRFRIGKKKDTLAFRRLFMAALLNAVALLVLGLLSQPIYRFLAFLPQ